MQDDNCHLVSPAAVQQDLTVTDPASQAFILIPAASFHSANINIRILTTNLLLAQDMPAIPTTSTPAYTTGYYSTGGSNSTSWWNEASWWNETEWTSSTAWAK